MTTKTFRLLLQLSTASAVTLLVINLVGFVIPLRSPTIGPDYPDFARPTTFTYQVAQDLLDQLAGAEPVHLIEQATRIFHYGMAHINPSQIEKNGLDFYRMRVPVWENYLLYALSHLKPDTYLDYEFCSYRRALRRGTGRCGQQSLALVDFLSQQGIETGFVRLGGHALVTAKVADATWYMLDADFGGVIPFDLAQAERDPASVLPHYWNDAASKRSLHLRFGPENNGLRYGGPEARFGRACRIEYLAYIMKWLIPVTLLLPLVWVLVRRTKRLTNLRW